MGWFATLFPAEASEKAHLQQQVLQMQQQVLQMQQQMNMQAALIARMNTTLVHLRAENAVLSNAGAFLDKKVERFQAAAATMLRDSDNILSHNPILRSVISPGAVSCTSPNCWTITNTHPPSSREQLEAIRRAASNIRQDNYETQTMRTTVRLSQSVR